MLDKGAKSNLYTIQRLLNNNQTTVIAPDAMFNGISSCINELSPFPIQKNDEK
jgi:hypothetical protein